MRRSKRTESRFKLASKAAYRLINPMRTKARVEPELVEQIQSFIYAGFLKGFEAAQRIEKRKAKAKEEFRKRQMSLL